MTNLIFDLKCYFKQNIQQFCFKNQVLIFLVFCLVNTGILLYFLDFVTVIILVFWLVFIYTILFFILQANLPCLQFFFFVIILTHLHEVSVRYLPLLVFLGMFLVWVFLVCQFFLKDTSMLRTFNFFLKNYKSAKKIILNHQVTEFFYFKTFSALMSCIFLIGVLLKKFYKIESLIVFFENLDSEKRVIFIPFLLTLSFSIVILSIIDWLIIEHFNMKIFLSTFRYFMKCETLFRVTTGLAGMIVVGGAVDHYAMSPEKFYSLPGCSEYRKYRMKFDWTIPLSLTLAAEYSELTNGCLPPLLETGFVDTAKTAERIKILKDFKESQKVLMAEYLKSDQISFDDIIKFNHQQTLIYLRFYKRVDSGLLRSEKPKNPRIEFYFTEEEDSIQSRTIIDEED